MKNVLLNSKSLFLTLAIAATIFNACKKKASTSTTNPTTFASSFSYKKDGVPMTVNSIVAAKMTFPVALISINASTTAQSQSLLLQLDTAATTGVHELGFFGPYLLQYSNFTTSQAVGSFEGTGAIVTVTKHDIASKIVEGTFSGTLFDNFSATDSVKITEGVFKVKY